MNPARLPKNHRFGVPALVRNTGLRALRLSSFLACLLACAAAPAATVFPFGSSWKFTLGTAEASNPTDAWRTAGFVDTAWSSGNMPIGYGEPDIVTSVPTSAAGGYNTIYFRKSFNIAD